MKYAAILTLLFALASASEIEWSYANQSAWQYLEDSSCGGMRQSPINIVTADVQESEDLEALVFNSAWDDEVDGSFSNTNHSVTFKPGGSTTGATIVNHRGTYNFAQFHFHWGSSDLTGSEHLVNGEQYPAELHFVHTKQGGEITDGDYHAVVGVFCEATDDPATGIWRTLLDNLPIAHGAENSITDVVYSDLLPDNRDYYYYMGSLTTPRCGETVQWFVLKETIEVPTSVLEAFRTVVENDGVTLLQTNFRDPQDLNGRVVQTPESGALAAGASAAVTLTLAAILSAFQ